MNNTFTNIENGFILERCLTSISDATISNLIGEGGYVYQPNDLAWLSSAKGYGVLAVNSWGSISNNTISDIHTGILADHGRIKLEDNDIQNVNTGIHARTVYNFGNRIKGNTISDFTAYGIRGFIKAQGILSIYYNTLTSHTGGLSANQDRIGISVNSVIADNNSNGYILENTINMESLGTAISLMNVGGLPIQRNNIDYDYPLQPQAAGSYGGIKLDNSDANNITDNNIDVNFSGGSDASLSGIWAEGSNSNAYCCNDIDGSADGMRFEGMGNSSKIWSNDFRSNGNYGLFCADGTVLGVQPHHGNTWFATPNGVKHEGTTFTQVEESAFEIEPKNTLPANQLFWPEDEDAITAWFVEADGTSSTACPGYPTCRKIYIAKKWPTDGTGVSVSLQEPGNDDLLYARGKFSLGTFGATLNWEGQRNLYAQLSTDPNFSNYHSSIDSFYQAHSASNIQKLYAVDESIKDLYVLTTTEEEDMDRWQVELDSLLEVIQVVYANYAKPNADHAALNSQMDGLQQHVAANLNSLMTMQENLQQARINNISATEALNDGLATGTIYEDNEQRVNAIFLSTIAKDIFTFNQQEKNTLGEIAFQCPFTDGYAVYRARAMYRLMEPSILFNDDLLCGQAQQKQSEQEEFENIENTIISISPNPANDLLKIHVMKQESDLQLGFRSITGQLLKSVTLPLGREYLTINTTDLPVGIYYLSVSSEEKVVEVKKVVIVH